MTIDRAVLCFAGFMMLLSALLVWLVQPVVAAADRVRRPQHDAGQRHRLLPGRHGVQGDGRQGGLRVPVSAPATSAEGGCALRRPTCRRERSEAIPGGFLRQPPGDCSAAFAMTGEPPPLGVTGTTLITRHGCRLTWINASTSRTLQ